MEGSLLTPAVCSAARMRRLQSPLQNWPGQAELLVVEAAVPPRRHFHLGVVMRTLAPASRHTPITIRVIASLPSNTWPELKCFQFQFSIENAPNNFE